MMKFRTGIFAGVLAAAGVVGIASVALAQQPPTPPPPPTAPTADPNAPPAPPPSGTAAPAAPPPTTTAPPPAPPPPGAPPVDPNAPPPPAGAPPAAPPTDTGAPQVPQVDPAAPPGPPAAPPVAPAPPVAAPPPQPPLQWGPPGVGPDATTSGSDIAGKGPTKPLPWRGTSFTWNQAGTTTIFGVGGDNIGSEGEVYGWEFTLSPSYYLLDLPKDKVRAFVDIGWGVELTNSDTTTDRNETLFRDMQVGLGYTRSIWQSTGKEDGEYKTSGSLTGRLLLPTSNASYNSGRYLTTALGLGLKQQVKILGTKADGLNNITVGILGTWGHLFARSYTATNEDLNRPRQNASGRSFDSDQLSTTSLAMNRLTGGLSFDLPLYKDLSMSTQFRIVGNFKHDFEAGAGNGCDVAIANDPCVQADRLDDRTLYQPLTTFDLAFSYPVFDVVGVTLGYNNETTWIGESGQRRGIFYSRDAQFYLDLTANLDVIYSKVTNRDKKAAAAPAKANTASR